MELDAKLEKMTEYKTQLSQIKIDENATKASLDTAKKFDKQNTAKISYR